MDGERSHRSGSSFGVHRRITNLHALILRDTKNPDDVEYSAALSLWRMLTPPHPFAADVVCGVLAQDRGRMLEALHCFVQVLVCVCVEELRSVMACSQPFVRANPLFGCYRGGLRARSGLSTYLFCPTFFAATRHVLHIQQDGAAELSMGAAGALRWRNREKVVGFMDSDYERGTG